MEMTALILCFTIGYYFQILLTYDQESESKQRRLRVDVQINREINGKVVGIGEGFLHEAGPFLGQLTDLHSIRGSDNLPETRSTSRLTS